MTEYDTEKGRSVTTGRHMDGPLSVEHPGAGLEWGK